MLSRVLLSIASTPRSPLGGRHRPVRRCAGPAFQRRRSTGTTCSGFQQHRYTHIDPAQQQDELTSLVQPAADEPFVLHPGKFVLGATLECCTLPDGGRPAKGKSSLGRLGLLTHSTAGFIDPAARHITPGTVQCGEPAVLLWPGMKIGQLWRRRRLMARLSTRTGAQRSARSTRASVGLPRPVLSELPLAGRVTPGAARR